MSVGLKSETFEAGVAPGAGSFACLGCDAPVVLTALDELPECPSCGSTAFRRASMFEHASSHEAATSESVAEPDVSPVEWLRKVRDEIGGPGHFVAYRDRDEVTLLALEDGWTRIGRSTTADIRLDDPTVSRRHALLVRQADKVRVLDDRSLNGLFVNGEQIDWKPLRDGDELTIGRYRLHFIEA